MLFGCVAGFGLPFISNTLLAQQFGLLLLSGSVSLSRARFDTRRLLWVNLIWGDYRWFWMLFTVEFAAVGVIYVRHHCFRR